MKSECLGTKARQGMIKQSARSMIEPTWTRRTASDDETLENWCVRNALRLRPLVQLMISDSTSKLSTDDGWCFTTCVIERKKEHHE
jgi:hypothetical protein